MEKHKRLLKEKFPHAKEDLLYNSGGNMMWSLFRTQSGGVTIYYHDLDEFHILSTQKTANYSLSEIANRWDPNLKKIIPI